MFDAAGLPHLDELEKVPNSQRALMLSELARDRGRLAALHARLFDAYWARGRDLGDEGVLAQEGREAGLEVDEIDHALSNEAYRRRIDEQTRMALELGASGVPAWLIDERVLVPGAQPHAVFDQVLTRLGYSPRVSPSTG